MTTATNKLLEKFEQERSLKWFGENENVELLLEVARCPGDRGKIATLLLDIFGSFKNILEAREEQLEAVDGIGPKTAMAIKLVLNFMRKWQESAMEEGKSIKNTTEAGKYCRSLLLGNRTEQFYVVCLDSRCRIIGERKVSEGSLSEVNAYPRIVIETALNYNAHSVLLCHNHPGGTNHPSGEDIQSTLRLRRTLSEIGVNVLDHIIVSGNDIYSMMQHGDIPARF